MHSYALGLIETKGLIGAIEATDAAAKAAAVVISSAELTDAAFMTVRIEGELGAVQAAVEAGAQAASRIGELVAAHIIPRPSDGLAPITPNRRYISKYHESDNRPALSFDDETSMNETSSSPVNKQRVSSPAAKPESIATHASPPRPQSIQQTPPVVRTATPSVPKPTVQRELPPRPPVAQKQSETTGSKESTPTRAELETMPVVALRQFARGVKNLPIQGRQISMANRQQLIDAIASVLPLK